MIIDATSRRHPTWKRLLPLRQVAHVDPDDTAASGGAALVSSSFNMPLLVSWLHDGSARPAIEADALTLIRTGASLLPRSQLQQVIGSQ